MEANLAWQNRCVYFVLDLVLFYKVHCTRTAEHGYQKISVDIFHVFTCTGISTAVILPVMNL